jgi:hypothetical protein
MMTPEEKDIVLEDIKSIVGVVDTLFSKKSESWEHLTACLNDRKIEIERGEWDNDIDENNKVEAVKP